MDLRKQFEEETKQKVEETFQECPSAPEYECGFIENYVEWLEGKVKNLNIGCVSKQRKPLIAMFEQFNEDLGFPTDNSNIPEFVDNQLKAIYGY